MQIDLNIYPNTRIARAHPAIKPIAVIVRELIKPLRKYTKLDITYQGDGITTRHNCGFLKTDKFKKAYAKCCRSHGSVSINIQWRVHQALWCAEIAKNLEGDFIEFGTGNGLVMSSVLEVYADWHKSNKKLTLVDTFCPYELDDETGKQSEGNGVHPFYAKSLDYVKSNFSKFDRVEFMIGFVPDVLAKLALDRLSFIHIDMNYFAPEIAALEYCWRFLVKGGVVLLDDYACGGHVQQYEAMNTLAKKLNFEILSTPTGQGIIVKS